MPAQLSEFAVVLLAISLATERFVVIVKTLVARLQSPGERELRRKPPPPGARAAKPRKRSMASAALDRVMSHPIGEKERRTWVIAASVIGAYLTTALVATTDDVGFLSALVGRIAIGGREWPVWIVAIMATGGSAFWGQVVAYASALKDIQQTQATPGAPAAATAPGANGKPDLSEVSWADIKRSSNLSAVEGGR